MRDCQPRHDASNKERVCAIRIILKKIGWSTSRRAGDTSSVRRPASAAGVAMALPKVVNAVAVTEIGRDDQDAGRHVRRLLRAPGIGHGSGRARVAGHLRTPPRISPDGQAARRNRLLGARREPVLSHPEGPDGGQGCGDADSRAAAAGKDVERDHTHDRREGVHGVARSAGVGGEEPQDRNAGLLHGRAHGVPHGGGVPIASARSHPSTAAGW